MEPPQVHDLAWFSGWHNPKEVDVLGASLGCAVSSPEVFLAGSHLPHLMDLRAHEVSGGSHVPEDRREVILPLVLIVRPVSLVVIPPSCSEEL